MAKEDVHVNNKFNFGLLYPIVRLGEKQYHI